MEILGPFGNKVSNIKIAYLVGMHPFESKAHKALFDMMVYLNNSLNYCYYIYHINVTCDYGDDEGRMSGQLLAQEFVAPHVIKNNYVFVIDIHSNKGQRGPGLYEKTNFIFAPGFDNQSNGIIKILLEKIKEIVYYAPEYRTSPPFITLPIVNEGIPTIVYETFSYEPMQKTYDLSEKLIKSVDDLNFKEILKI